MEELWRGLLGGLRVMELGDGWSLRLLSAMEVLEARREAEALAPAGRERALCSNACLLARALCKDGEAWFANGAEALEGLSMEEVAVLAKTWAQFNRGENPSAQDEEGRVDALKKALSTRPTPDFSGVCSKLLAPFRRRRGRGR